MRVTVGVGADETETVTDRLAVPPGPLQLSVNVLSAVNAPLDWLPEVFLEPDQLPEALHELALLVVQFRVDALLNATWDGVAVSVMVGACGGVETVTVTD